MHSLTRDELAALLAAAKKHSARDYIMISTAFRHGMRASEITQLTAGQVRSGYITVLRLKGSDTNVQSCSPELTEFAHGKTGRLFDIQRRQFHNVIRMHGKTAGIPEHKRHAHSLKHTTAMLMLEGGGKINEVQKRLGHKNGGNTLKYLCVSDDVASRAFQAAVGSF
jgi:integrase